MTLVPEALPHVWAIGLVALSFVTSGIAAVFGIGGGSLLLAAMATVLPVATVIPLHGVVQLFSNGGRAVLQAKFIDRTVLPPFLVGTIVGSIMGGRLVVDIRDDILKLGLALFILVVTWMPSPRIARAGPWIFGAVGLSASFVNMFVGATGPFVGAIIRARGYDRMQVIGTHAAGMTCQHGVKILVFGALGFAFAPWLPFLIAMTVSGFAGTWTGTKLLGRMSDKGFHLIFRLMLTAAALHLAATVPAAA